VGPDKCASCPTQHLLAAALCLPLGWQLAHSLSSFSEEAMPNFIVGIMAVDENGNSAAEGFIDPNCPVFARLNLELPEASWTVTQHAVSKLSVKKILP